MFLMESYSLLTLFLSLPLVEERCHFLRSVPPNLLLLSSPPSSQNHSPWCFSHSPPLSHHCNHYNQRLQYIALMMMMVMTSKMMRVMFLDCGCADDADRIHNSISNVYESDSLLEMMEHSYRYSLLLP